MSQPAGTTELPSAPEDWSEREQQAVEETIHHIRDPGIAKEHFGVSAEHQNWDSKDSEDKRQWSLDAHARI
jgi:hypothetical protein